MIRKNCRILTIICLIPLYITAAAAWQQESPPSGRKALLKELEKCVKPDLDCDELAVSKVGDLYKKGDKSVLPKLMDLAPHSDGALSETLGDFFSELLCRQPGTFLQAVARRPYLEQENLLFLAAAADGGGMGCRHISTLRQTLRQIGRNSNDKLSDVAKRCLQQVDKYNPPKSGDRR